GDASAPGARIVAPERLRARRRTRMDIRQLEAFLAVAEAGSFTTAADQLHTVQSNVSEHVRQLEAELGVQLLVRGRRVTVPTEFGVRVIERARAVRSEIDALHKDLATETLILPPAGNPLRDEVETAARAERVELRVPIEVEGVRLIADLVAAGAGVSILPESAVAHDHAGVRQMRIARMPPRRLAVVTARGVQLSLADQAVHDAVRRIVRDERRPDAERSA